jgi:hypothetical protein
MEAPITPPPQIRTRMHPSAVPVDHRTFATDSKAVQRQREAIRTGTGLWVAAATLVHDPSDWNDQLAVSFRVSPGRQREGEAVYFT